MFTAKSRKGENNSFGERGFMFQRKQEGFRRTKSLLWRVSQMPSAFTMAKSHMSFLDKS